MKFSSLPGRSFFDNVERISCPNCDKINFYFKKANVNSQVFSCEPVHEK